MGDRVILHCDLDNFFASVECTFRPELRDVPMAVCGSESERHGIVLAKNQLAKKARGENRADRLAGALALSRARLRAAAYGKIPRVFRPRAADISSLYRPCRAVQHRRMLA